jgi:hypothetical protein
MAGSGLGIADFMFGKKYQFPQIPASVEKRRLILMAARPVSPHFDRCFSPGQNLGPAGGDRRSLLAHCWPLPEKIIFSAIPATIREAMIF